MLTGPHHVNRTLSCRQVGYCVSDPMLMLVNVNVNVISREDVVSVVKNYTYDDGCEPCGTDVFNREPFVVMFSSRNSGMSLLGDLLD